MSSNSNFRLILLFIFTVICTLSRAESETVTMTSFTHAAGKLDENISFEAVKNSPYYTPDVYNQAIRVYQNGGIFVIRANNHVVITDISIGSANETLITYACDHQATSSEKTIKANKKLKLTALNVKDSVLFTCTSHHASGRLNINYLSVTYQKPASNNVILDESAENNMFSAGPANVTLRRTFNVGAWNTLVLPFKMTSEQIVETFGSHAKIASYTGAIKLADNTYKLQFDTSKKEIMANKPVFIYGITQKSEYIINNVELEEAAPAIETSDGFSFTGAYHKTVVQRGDWFVSADNKLYQAAGTETIKPFRAVFRPVSNTSNAKAMALSFVADNGTVTTIKPCTDTILPPTDTPLYNLSGQRVNKYYRGIVIQNGKKQLHK